MNLSPTSTPIRLGLCGIGRTGFGRIRSELSGLLGTSFVLAGGYDLLFDRAQQLHQLFNATPHRDFQGLLDDPTVELVVVATRSDSHAALAMSALLAGKHVVVEKPMGVSLAEADRLLEVASRSPGRLFVRLNRRFDPPFQAVLDCHRRGHLGRLHSVQIRAGDFVRRNDWQTLRKFGGGQLLNWGPHVIDWALELIGGTALDVVSHTRLLVSAGDAEDHVKLLLRGPDDAIADIEVSGANAARQPLFVVQGDRGAVVADTDSVTCRYLKTPVDRSSLRADESTPPQDDRRYKALSDSDFHHEPHPLTPRSETAYWEAVHRTLRESAPFPITLDRAREVMRVIESARQHAATGGF